MCGCDDRRHRLELGLRHIIANDDIRWLTTTHRLPRTERRTVQYIVTIKQPSNPLHDPLNKVAGVCPASTSCTDATGEHHSVAVQASSMAYALAHFARKNIHVTRIEELNVVHDINPEQT